MEYWLKDAPNIDFSKVELLDWIEGYGQIMSIAERDFIRHFGDLINDLKDRIDAVNELLTTFDEGSIAIYENEKRKFEEYKRKKFKMKFSIDRE